MEMHSGSQLQEREEADGKHVRIYTQGQGHAS
jgi:hypothetical protein